MSRAPTISDVSRCYRLLLDREVENATVAGQHIMAAPGVLDLVELIWASPEAVRHRIGDALRSVSEFHAAPAPEIDADGGRLDDLHADVERVWTKRGLGSYQRWLKRGEPRYSDRSVRWNIELILASGEVEARGLLDLLARHGLSIRPSDRVAVLGADAFRLAPVVAPLAERYLAIEVHEKDLELASEALKSHGLRGVTACSVSAFRAGAERVDLFHSVEALQYAPPPVQHDLLKTVLARLNPGGVVVFQLACHLHGYAFDIDRYLGGEGRDAMGEIHAIAQRHVLSLLAAERVAVLEIIPDGRLGPLGVSYTFVGRKEDLACDCHTAKQGDLGVLSATPTLRVSR